MLTQAMRYYAIMGIIHGLYLNFNHLFIPKIDIFKARVPAPMLIVFIL